jgi:apoptosis-inducing factor 3
VLVFIAGHETTVNLIANGMLTMLRQPELLDRVRREPDLVIGLVEELLRYEPPVQMIPSRTALADVTVGDTTIPAGSPVVLLLAAGSRDPQQFEQPERFDPDRHDHQHLGFRRRDPLLLRRAPGAAGGPARAARVGAAAGEPAARRGPAPIPAQPDPARAASPADRDRRRAGLVGSPSDACGFDLRSNG